MSAHFEVGKGIHWDTNGRSRRLLSLSDQARILYIYLHMMCF